MQQLSDSPTPIRPRLRWLGLALALFIAFHFGATLVYTVDALPLDPRIRHRASGYMKPLFHQGWKLFAPDVPTCSPAFDYRIANGGKWSTYKAVLGHPGLPEHPKLRYMTDKLAAYLMNALRMQCGDRPAPGAVDARALQSGSFFRCASFATRIHALTATGPADSLQLRLILTHTPPFGGGDREGDTVVELPVLPLSHAMD